MSSVLLSVIATINELGLSILNYGVLDDASVLDQAKV